MSNPTLIKISFKELNNQMQNLSQELKTKEINELLNKIQNEWFKRLVEQSLNNINLNNFLNKS